MPHKLKESDYFLSWIVMVLCYVVTYAMVGFVFGMVGMAMGYNVHNQGRLLDFITTPMQLLTSYFCFRFLTKELASKAAEKALDEKRDRDRAAKAKPIPSPDNKPTEIAPPSASSEAM